MAATMSMQDAVELWGRSMRLPPRMAEVQLPDYAVTFALSIRFTDIDMLGHVNNVTYGTYFEEARMDLLRVMWRQVEINPSIVVAHLDMEFHRPLYLHDQPRVGVRVTTIGTSRFDVQYLLHTDVPVCTGRTVLVWYDYGTGRSAPIPEPFRKVLARMQTPNTTVKEEA